jgi:mannose-1-phosphate guanylyltransferase/mannose-6-phosphate isomerase
MLITPVILSGGSGTRLWPLSRKQYPKQYLPLTSNNTMLQETLLRLNGLDNLTDPIIICNAEHRFLVAEQCKVINIINPKILLEPVGRNTAPAIAAAALHCIKETDDVLLLVLSADHYIQDVQALHNAINIAKQQAQKGKLATFGIAPTDANTGYGYIKASRYIEDGVYKVEDFFEKPSLEQAEKYLDQRNYLWNSGMFMFKADSFIRELSSYSPKIVTSVNKAVNNAIQDLDFIRLDRKAFESSPSDSIDYTLMEKSDNLVVIPLETYWSDIGSWSALHDIGEKDINGNVIQGDVFTEETSNTYISANHHMVATIGIEGLVIVDTPDVTLISTRDKVKKVKKVLEQLKEQNREEQLCHRKVYRPWGWYDSIESGENFQVKRLYVKPGAKLSLQMHHKRAEHWVVISGTATVTNNSKTFNLNKGESTYIPLGVIHGLANNTNKILEIIEIQSGTYLGEDDIVRFEDIYGRVE